MGRFDQFFQLAGHGTTVRRELTAGLTTFAAMAYILAVNPAVLSAAAMDPGAVITATALASALMTAAMALATNYPIALAPGMGMNAFLAYTVCVGMKVPWPAALGMTFLSGVLFLVLSLTGIRRTIIEAIPPEIKTAITCGIGLFIAMIGLKNGGVIAGDPVTYLKAGHLGTPGPLLVLGGVCLAAILIHRKIHGAIILTIATLTLAGLFLPAPGGQGMLTAAPERWVDWPASLAPTFLKMDLGYSVQNVGRALPLILAILFVDLFDNLGTLIGVSARAGLLDAQGNLPRLGRALTADASAAMVGASLGTSTVTSYIESAAGVEEGGRTGLTALTVAACFLLALFFHPLIRMVPAIATAPALVIVGLFMMQGVARLPLQDFAKGAPAIITMVMMPFTFSISEGLAIGFLFYVVFAVGCGRGRAVTPVAYLLGIIFLLHLLFRP